MFARIILAPCLFVVGVLLMKYTVQVTAQTGKFDWAEKLFGTGVGAGTYTFWRLFGFTMCILSVLWLFGKLPHTSF